MKPYLRVALIAMLVILAGIAIAQNGDDVDGSQYAGNPELAIPPFPDGLEWVNVERPLTPEDLHGKIVIMDFWTYGCINCIHMIPVLKALEAQYAEELVVIGVHSAKFANEGETQNIQQIVERYGIEHPVINDKDFAVWQMYGSRAWPTFVIADPRGNVLAAQSGEIPLEAFQQVMDGMIDYFDATGEIDRTPIDAISTGARTPGSLLSFPGKVLVDVAGNRLFIADSSNNRIVIADLVTFEVQTIIGTGTAGYTDGAFAEAQFDKPQGMALKDEVLYIADVNNHTIRTADLTTGTVDTLAGTGQMGRGVTPYSLLVREPRGFDLRSPWDVEFGDDTTLYIAMAGTHQIWQYDLETGHMRASVGNGREAMLNATLETSELAQPSGLYYTNGLLYFADSESSTLRVADYNNNTVMTVSGTLENNLFDFGDIDGPVGESRLQHVLGVDGDDDDLIYIADTYNSRIKAIDSTMNTATLYGLGGNGGFADGGPEEAQFDEPGGLDYVEMPDGSRKLFVADTNNHAIRIIDLDTQQVSTVEFPNPEALVIGDRVTVLNRADRNSLMLDAQTVTAGEGTIVVKLTIPDGYKLNPLADSLATWTGGESVTVNNETLLESDEVSIPATFNADGTLTGELTVYFCEAVNESLCFIDTVTVEIPVTVAEEGADTITINRELVPPDLN